MKITKHPLYKTWENIKQRCINKNNRDYPYYGGRGIDLYKHWHNSKVFCEWGVNNGYKQGLSLDRIDNDKGYNPDNCRFTTQTVQSRNGRILRKTNTSGYRGVEKIKDNYFRARIKVNYKGIHITTNKCRLACAYAYDEYIRDNNLEHTKNFV